MGDVTATIVGVVGIYDFIGFVHFFYGTHLLQIQLPNHSIRACVSLTGNRNPGKFASTGVSFCHSDRNTAVHHLVDCIAIKTNLHAGRLGKNFVYNHIQELPMYTTPTPIYLPAPPASAGASTAKRWHRSTMSSAGGTPTWRRTAKTPPPICAIFSSCGILTHLPALGSRAAGGDRGHQRGRQPGL